MIERIKAHERGRRLACTLWFQNRSIKQDTFLFVTKVKFNDYDPYSYTRNVQEVIRVRINPNEHRWRQSDENSQNGDFHDQKAHQPISNRADRLVGIIIRAKMYQWKTPMKKIFSLLPQYSFIRYFSSTSKWNRWRRHRTRSGPSVGSSFQDEGKCSTSYHTDLKESKTRIAREHYLRSFTKIN